MVVNKNGTTEQVTHYYPYGGLIGDISTLLSDVTKGNLLSDVTKGNNENVQKYKFEGPRSHQKEIDNLLARRRAFRRGVELDRTFGLDNYDIHARQYFAMMPSWDRIDPQAENIFAGSPYLYCGGDPVNFGDYNGCDYWSTSNPEVIKQFLYEYNSGLGFCNFNFDGWLHTSDIDFINGLSYNDESNFYYFTKPFVDDDAFGISCKVFSNKWLLSSEGLVFETLEYGIKDFYKNLWNKQKTTYKSQIAYDILKRFPYKVNTKPSTVYNKIIPNTIAKIGKGVGGIGACISLRNIYSNVSNNNYLGVGDATSLAIVGIGLFASSSISVPVCVLYMVSDLITYGITSKTIDEHLNNKWHIDLPE